MRRACIAASLHSPRIMLITMFVPSSLSLIRPVASLNSVASLYILLHPSTSCCITVASLYILLHHCCIRIYPVASQYILLHHCCHYISCCITVASEYILLHPSTSCCITVASQYILLHHCCITVASEYILLHPSTSCCITVATIYPVASLLHQNISCCITIHPVAILHILLHHCCSTTPNLVYTHTVHKRSEASPNRSISAFIPRHNGHATRRSILHMDHIVHLRNRLPLFS